LEPFKLIIRSFFARPMSQASKLQASISRSLKSSSRRALLAFVTAVTALTVTSCTHNYYQFPEYTFAGRPIPPSSLGERVMVGVSTNGTSGALIILDGLRNLRNNIQNTNPGWSISGYSGAAPSLILNFPEQTRGYVYSSASPYPLSTVSYSTESSSGSAGNLGGAANSIAVSPDFLRIYGAVESNGQLVVIDQQLGQTFALNLPNVYKVAVNTGDTVAVAMVRNSNSLYRVIKLNTTQATVAPPGAIDCEPNILPVYCVVPVPGTFDRPYGAYFSLDGSNVYIENCGVECGGGSNGGSGFSIIPQAPLNLNLIPTSAPYPAVVTKTVSVPGGVTDMISDGVNLYTSGQQLQTSGPNAGLFAGNLTVIPLSTLTPAAPISISDGSHSKMLFADNNTLWIGSQNCANGVRAALATAGNTTQAANYNCLTRYVTSGAILPTWTAQTAYSVGQEVTDGVNTQVVQTAGTSGGSTPSWNASNNGVTTDSSVVWVNIGPTARAQVIPAVTPNNTASTALTVPYPNTNQNYTYYGSLTGICWVQEFFKVYTAYGGQVHAFNTVDGSEINNVNITVQGTALDVAYMDALTNDAD
jgi:hypothetical protein